MLSTVPVGYTYKAELLCPNCTIEELKKNGIAELYDDSSEETIRLLANKVRVDYSDPYSYDSDEFPKPVLSIELDCSEDEHEKCDACGRNLCD